MNNRFKSGCCFGRFIFLPNVGKGKKKKIQKEEKIKFETIVPVNISPLESIIEIHHLEVDMELYASVIQEEVIANIF